MRGSLPFLFLIVLAACGDESEKPRQAPAVPVTVTEVKVVDLPRVLRAVGEVEPLAQVDVVSQVTGVLKAIHVQEGSTVQAGDLLFQIDPLPFEAELKKAEATLARDVAQLRNAEAQVNRYERLVEKEYVSREQFDQARATRDALVATVKANQASVEDARIQLGYTTLRSPIQGRVGAFPVKVGNLVQANNRETPLVRINQLRPISVRFTLPEIHVDELRARFSQGSLVCRVRIAGEQGQSNEELGKLIFIDNEVNRTTGTILLKAQFDNPTEKLWPGQFVDIGLEIQTISGATVVPSSAVQVGQDGEYVFVVSNDNTANIRNVTTGIRDGSLVVVNGVEAGERVVTNGHVRLAPGVAVSVTTGEAPAAATERKGSV